MKSDLKDGPSASSLFQRRSPSILSFRVVQDQSSIRPDYAVYLVYLFSNQFLEFIKRSDIEFSMNINISRGLDNEPYWFQFL